MKNACYSYNYLKLLAILSRNLRHIGNNDKHKGKKSTFGGPSTIKIVFALNFIGKLWSIIFIHQVFPLMLLSSL